jgi:hypothetical protein
MWQPPDEWKLVKFARFFNILDPDFNILSPTRIQAWGATAGALYNTIHADFSTVAGGVQGGLSVIYAGLAHVIHQKDKKQSGDQKVAMVKASLYRPDLPQQ